MLHPFKALVLGHLSEPSLTCDVDLHLQMVLLGDRDGGSLGHHTGLDGFGHHSSGRCRLCAAPTRPALPRRRGVLLRRSAQEVTHQQQPIEDQEDTQVIENHREAGRVTRRPGR